MTDFELTLVIVAAVSCLIAYNCGSWRGYDDGYKTGSRQRETGLRIFYKMHGHLPPYCDHANCPSRANE